MNESKTKDLIEVEVAYATIDTQHILNIEIDSDSNLEDAINLSGIIDIYPEIDLTKNKIGIFGKLSKKTASLKAGDRVGIYRPLIADPKEVRRKREAEGKKMKKGGS